MVQVWFQHGPCGYCLVCPCDLLYSLFHLPEQQRSTKNTCRKPKVITTNDCLIFKSREPPFLLLYDTSQRKHCIFLKSNKKKIYKKFELLKLTSGSGTGVNLGSIFKWSIYKTTTTIWDENTQWLFDVFHLLSPSQLG